MQTSVKNSLLKEFLNKVEKFTGVRYDIDKEYFIISRLTEQIAGSEFKDPWDLIHKACFSNDKKWCENLFCKLLIHETYFFREKDVFEYLIQEILSLRQNNIKPPISIWSASCSNGQEAITLAIALEEAKLRDKNLQFNIHASDLDSACIQKAKTGLYSSLEVRRGLSEHQKNRYFQKHSDQWLLNDSIKKHITYEQLNLMDSFLFKQKFDVIFLRNTLIYFNDEIRLKLIENIINQTKPGGYIVLGSVENIPRKNVLHSLKNIYKGIYQVL